MIILEQSAFIGKGGNQGVYHHPDDESLCVKVNLDSNSKVAEKRLKRELKFYKKFKKKSIHIPCYHGTAETNKGMGYIYQKVTNYDGTVSEDLFNTLKRFDAREESIISSIRNLGEFLYKERILFHDGLLTGNSLCRKIAPDSYEIVVIDGLGDTVLIPILNYIPSHARSRISKKWYKYLVKDTVKHYPWIKREEIEI